MSTKKSPRRARRTVRKEPYRLRPVEVEAIHNQLLGVLAATRAAATSLTLRGPIHPYDLGMTLSRAAVLPLESIVTRLGGEVRR